MERYGARTVVNERRGDGSSDPHRGSRHERVLPSPLLHVLSSGPPSPDQAYNPMKHGEKRVWTILAQQNVDVAPAYLPVAWFGVWIQYLALPGLIWIT